MDGLTNIITKINEQSDAQCEAVINLAKDKANNILEKAKSEAEQYLNDNKEALEKLSAAEKAKADSAADFEYKRVMLGKKCEIIDTCLEKALESMCKARDEVYFGYVKTLALKHALKGEGSVSFSKKDLDRLPDGFENELNKGLCEGKKLKISQQTLDTDGGFVINYPEMRVDCTFSSLLEENADSIKDAINKLLFS